MGRKNAARLIGSPIPEGVRFELGETVSLAVRNADHDVGVHVYPQTHFFRDFFSSFPLIRGVVRLFSCLSRFFSGLNGSALLNPQESARGTARIRKTAKLFQTTPQSIYALVDFLWIPVLFLGGLWLIPYLVQLLLETFNGIPRFAVNAVCCAFRVAGLFLSVAMVSRLKLINRYSMYRGAMAKVTNAYEIYGANVTEAEISHSSLLTERSDGVFLLLVLSLTIIGGALIRTDAVWLRIPVRIGLILVASALVGEILLPIEHARADTILSRLRSRMARLQLVFTLEPHPQMLEVALCALHAATENDISDVIDEKVGSL